MFLFVPLDIKIEVGRKNVAQPIESCVVEVVNLGIKACSGRVADRWTWTENKNWLWLAFNTIVRGFIPKITRPRWSFEIILQN